MVLLYQPAFLWYRIDLGSFLRPLSGEQVVLARKPVASRLDWRFPLHLELDKLPYGHLVGRRSISVVELPNDCSNRRWCHWSPAVAALGMLRSQTAFPQEVHLLQLFCRCGLRLRPVPGSGPISGSVLRPILFYGCTLRHSDRVRHQPFPGDMLLASSLSNRIGPHQPSWSLSLGPLSWLDTHDAWFRLRYSHGCSR